MFYDIDNSGNFTIFADDPYKEVEAVQFHETLVKLTFNLTQDFQISNIELEKDAIVQRSDTQRLKYQLQVFHCKPNPEAAINILEQGNDTYVNSTGRVITQSTIVYICLELVGKSANIGIREIAMLEFIQPKSQITSFAIYQRTPNAITTETHYGNALRKRLVVSTRLVLPFFDNRNPKYVGLTGQDLEDAKVNDDYDSESASKVIAKGTAIMMFQDDTAVNRHLVGMNRDLQEAGEEEEEPFEVELGLGYDEESSAFGVMVYMALSLVGVSSFFVTI